MNISVSGLIPALTLCFVSLSQHAIAQEVYRPKSYTLADGLLVKQVGSIRQDHLGFLWLNNWIRFDGYTFSNLRIEGTDSLTKLPKSPLGRDDDGNMWMANTNRGVLYLYDYRKERFDSYVPDLEGAVPRSFARGKGQNVIWIGGRGDGIFSFDLTTGETKRYINEASDPLAKNPKEFNRLVNFVFRIVDHENYLLLATGRGLWKFDKARNEFEYIPIKGYDLTYSEFPESAKFPQIPYIFPRDDHYWFHVNENLRVVLVKADLNFELKKKFVMPDDHHERLNSNVMTLARDGIFWIKTKKGLTSYNPNDGNLVVHDSTIEVQSIFADRDLNIWVGNSSGLHRFTKPDITFHNFNFGELPNNGTQPKLSGLELLSVDEKKYLVTATLGMGIQFLQYEGSSIGDFRFSPLRNTVGSKTLTWITAIEKDPGGLTVAAFHDDIYYEQHLFKISIDFQKGVIVKQNPSLKVIDTQNSQPALAPKKGIIQSIVADNDGNLLMGTATGLVGGWSYHTLSKAVLTGDKLDTIVAYHHNPAESGTISDGWVNHIIPESDASAWVATGGGLDLFTNGGFKHVFKDQTTWVCKVSNGDLLIGTVNGPCIGTRKQEPGEFEFSKIEKLDKINVAAIQEDRTGRLWISSTLNGLFCFDRKKDAVQHFTPEDGLLSTEFSKYSLQTKDGQMVFGLPNGVSVFNPMTFQPSELVHLPAITKLTVNNKLIGKTLAMEGENSFELQESINTLPELVLDFKHNIFSIEFASMEFKSPSKNFYAYKLDGFDPDWIQTDYKSRTATYTNLDPGTYTFKVKASNHHGVWSEQERTLKVVILPPPWRTWWAYTGYSLIVIGLLFGARRLIVQRERFKASMQLEHVELEKAKEVDRVKTSFFTNISHEFRTPLTLIKGPVETLLDRFKDDADVIKRLKLVQRNSDLLLRLINQLLDLAKLESGTLKVEKSEGEVYSFVRAVASTFDSFARQKNIVLKAEVPEGAWPAMFDKDKVETILINLINNAIKFTPSGGTVVVKTQIQSHAKTPTYAETATAGRQSREELTLIVKDTGIGIPADQQTRIFERFHQVSESHKEVGTGIGLSLVKELVSLMGGTISVKSEPGKGSEFTVTLPVESASSYKSQAASGVQFETEVILERTINNQQPTTNNGIGEESSTKPHVLVVEDNADLRAFIIDSLGTEFHFLQAENGKIGLDTATEQIPDLIISDVMMPEMDGMEMATLIKQDIKTSHIPLIMLTAKSGEESKLAGLRVGADDYLTKPFNKEELLLKVRNGVARQQKMRDKLRTELLSSAPKVEVMSEDEKFLNNVKEKILERMSDEQLSVESLADDIGMSRVQLYRKVSGLTGMAVNELIRKLRLQRAAQLLEQNWGPVSQVAYEVGFSNLSYFSKVFKEEFGVLPSEYEKV